MLKTIKMIVLSLSALVVANQACLDLPPHLLKISTPAHKVTVTAYANHPKCTGSGRGKTAGALQLSQKDSWKIIALSRDIGKEYEFGDQFQLWVKGKLYSVSYEDRMPGKHRKKVDLLLPSLESCRQFGRQSGLLISMGRT